MFSGKGESLLFSMLSSFFFFLFFPEESVPFLSQLQSLSVVILDPRKIKSVTVFIVFPCMCHEVMELDVIILVL